MRIGPLVAVVAAAVVMGACVGPDTPASGLPGGGPGPRMAMGTLEIHAVAAPTCPVEREPPAPACALRPVAGAQVVVTPADGREIAVATGVTDERGVLLLQIPVGEYLVSASDVEGLMGTPQSVPAAVLADQTRRIDLEYDTGIR